MWSKHILEERNQHVCQCDYRSDSSFTFMFVGSDFTSASFIFFAKEVMFWPVFLCLTIAWFVSRITQKLLIGFPWILAGRWVSAQNKSHFLLVEILIKGQIQEFFLTFLNIVRCEGLFQHFTWLMHGSWWNTCAPRWLVSMSEYHLMQIQIKIQI